MPVETVMRVVASSGEQVLLGKMRGGEKLGDLIARGEGLLGQLRLPVAGHESDELSGVEIGQSEGRVGYFEQK